jgi:hypothetical protein
MSSNGMNGRKKRSVLFGKEKEKIQSTFRFCICAGRSVFARINPIFRAEDHLLFVMFPSDSIVSNGNIFSKKAHSPASQVSQAWDKITAWKATTAEHEAVVLAEEEKRQKVFTVYKWEWHSKTGGFECEMGRNTF